MDWKRIMNKRHETVEIAGKEKVQQHLTQLLPELNLRLLLETEACSGNILWVEAVTVTGYLLNNKKIKKKEGFSYGNCRTICRAGHAAAH